MSSGVAASILPLTSCADLVIANEFLYMFITVESALSLAPMFSLLAKEYHLDQTQVGLLTGVCVLALGYSNFVIVPFWNIFGPRWKSFLVRVIFSPLYVF